MYTGRTSTSLPSNSGVPTMPNSGPITQDRQGITEIRYVEGMYTFLDELQQRHPDLIIDNCASGGRRLDLEMIRRSVTLTRIRQSAECHCPAVPGLRHSPVVATGVDARWRCPGQ